MLLIADDAGWNDVGYHGSAIATPNLDRLAGRGVRTEQFYACPTCSPTRASILMGRPPSRYGILAPIAGRSSLTLPTDRLTLASLLAAGGYFTALAGKWHLGLRPEVGPRRYGFQSSYGYLHGQLDQFTHLYKNGDRTWHRNEEFIEEKGHATDLIADEAVRIIRESSPEKPFFLYTAFSVPHYPLQENEEWVEPYLSSIPNLSRRLYAASMTHLDSAVGRIVEAVEQKGISGNTLVCFISDNGAQENWTVTENEYENRHGPNDVLGDNRPLRDWKGSVYEGGIRVPAVFYWPDRLAAGRMDSPAHVMDLLPTFAHLADVEVPGAMEVEGTDLWPELTGQSASAEKTLYWNTGSQLAARRGNWKIVHQGGSAAVGDSELFDLARDPLEKHDLSNEKPTLTAQMREILARQRALDRIAE